MGVRPRSLRVRVTVFGVATTLLVLAIGAFITVRALSSALSSDLANQNEAVLDALATAIEGGDDPASLVLPLGADGTEFAIFDSEGALVNLSAVPLAAGDIVISDVVVGEGDLGAAFPGDVVIADVGGDVPVDGVIVDDHGDGTMLLAPDGGLDFGAAIEAGLVYPEDQWFRTSSTVAAADGEQLRLDAYTPIGLIERSVDRLGWTMVFVVPIVSLLGGFALWRSVGSALRPIGRISDDARRIAPSNSGDRLPVPDSGDEVAELTTTLNGMLDRLDDGLIRQRQFVSDASHELRSPLTVVRGSAELLGSRELDDGTRASVERLQRGVDLLEAVLDDLTELASSSAGGDRSVVDVVEIAAARVDQWSEATDDVQIVVDAPQPIIVSANAIQVGRAIDNLVGNGLRHAKTTVSVSVSRVDRWAEVIVDDDGPGVPAEDRERIFERFVRLDDGRSRADGGSGLGLALVASIATDHGGDVSCGTSPDGGARFVLRLPVDAR